MRFLKIDFFVANIYIKHRGTLSLKLPWDRGYLKISFHVIFTLAAVYFLVTVIDTVVFIISDLRTIIGNIFLFFRGLISLFSPLVAALIVAYLLDPVADFYQNRYEKYKKELIPVLKKYNLYISRKKKKKDDEEFKKRLEGTVLTYVTVIIVFTIVINLLMSNLGIGSGDFADTVNQSVSSITTMINDLETRMEALGFLDFFLEYLDSVLAWTETVLLDFGNRAVEFATSAWNGLLNSLISSVVAFYFMTNKARLKYQVRGLADTFLPRKINTVITNIFEDLHAVFSGYIRGLILDGIILGTLVGIGLSLIGVDFAILIGVLTAIFNLIPFFGGIMAFFLSVTFELLMGSPINALYAAIVIIVIQQIDTIFIVPRIVGKKVHLSPPAVMISLSAAANLFGIVGMLLVVPVCATIKIFAGRFIARYREKKSAKSE